MQIGASTTASAHQLSANPQIKTAAPDDASVREEKTQSSTPSSTNSSEQRSEQRQLQSLKARDREVRAHELAHQAVGGRYITRGAQFDYEKGPDGRQYAVSGDVRIDTSPVQGDPQATIAKAQVIQRAALAPIDPSPTDRRVAAEAAALILQSRMELMTNTSEQNSPGGYIDEYA